MFAPVRVASLRAHVGCWGDGGGSCRLIPWHHCSVSSWLWLLVGPLVAKQRWWSGTRSSSCIVGRSRSWTTVEGAHRWWGAGSHLSTVVVVGTPWGAWFVGDVALPHLRPGLLLWWVTSLVVVAGVVHGHLVRFVTWRVCHGRCWRSTSVGGGCWRSTSIVGSGHHGRPW